MNISNSTALPEKEFTLIQEIVKNPDVTQRELSQSLGISLGMTNILLKRLARKGYIKANQLNWNKVRYLLTYKGALEKTRKSYAYALHAWRQARKISSAIQETVIAEYRQGARSAAIVAWRETAAVIQSALAEKDLPGLQIDYVDGFKYLKPDHKLVFTATVEPPPANPNGRRLIPLLDKMDLEFRFEG